MVHLILMTASEIDTVIKPNPQKKNPIPRLTGIYSRKSWISKTNYLILELLKPPKTERKRRAHSQTLLCTYVHSTYPRLARLREDEISSGYPPKEL